MRAFMPASRSPIRALTSTIRALSAPNCASIRPATVTTAVTMAKPVPTTVPMIHFVSVVTPP